MSQTEKRRWSRRAIKRLVWILAISVLLSAAGYLYFEMIVKEQKLMKEKDRLMHISHRLSAATKEMEEFSRIILIDKELQRLLQEQTGENEYQVQKRYDEIVERLTFYGNLRGYVVGSILKMEDGSCYGSSKNAADAGYLVQKLVNEAFVGYDKDKGVFSECYYDEALWGNKPLICYQTDLFDQYHFGRKRGTLYVELDLEHFLDELAIFETEDVYLCLTDKNGEILYAYGEDETLSDYLEQGKASSEEIQKIKGGYLLCGEAEGTGWKIYALITNGYF